MSRGRAGRAWSCAVAAVAEICGAPPPLGPGAQGGGLRPDRAGAERRKFALYTAVCGLGCCVGHVAEEAQVADRVAARAVRALEEQRGDPAVDQLLEDLTRRALEIMARTPAGIAA